MRTGIAGSPPTEGTTWTAGIVDGNSQSVTKRAMIIWGVAFAALVFFHVGGARL